MAEAALTGKASRHQNIAVIDEDAGLGDRTNLIFSGTVATFVGRVVVTATGMATEMAKSPAHAGDARGKDAALARIEDVGRKLGIGVVVIAVVIIATILLVDQVTSFAGIIETLLLASHWPSPRCRKDCQQS